MALRICLRRVFVPAFAFQSTTQVIKMSLTDDLLGKAKVKAEELKEGLEGLQHKASHLTDGISDTAKTTKDEYIAIAKLQLGDLQGDIAALQAKAADATGDIKEKFEVQLAELQIKLKEGETKLDEVIASADHLWEELKDEAEEKWSTVQEGLKDSLTKVKSFFA